MTRRRQGDGRGGRHGHGGTFHEPPTGTPLDEAHAAG